MSGYSHFARGVLRCALVAGYEVEAVESDVMERTTWFTEGGVHKEKFLPTPKIDLPEQQEWELSKALKATVAPDAPTLLIQIPPNLGAWSKFGASPLIGWTMTESDSLNPVWQHNCRCVDLLLAPSSHCLEVFRRVVPGVESRLLHIPVDDRLWSPDEFIAEIPGRPRFLFFSAFNTSERKQWRQLCVAFAEEFAGEQKEVGLLLRPSRWEEVEQLADACRDMGAWVYVDHEPCTDWVLGSFYRAADCYVQPSPEGFGLGPVEAGMCGRPSVALSLGGAADVVNEDCGYVCPASMQQIIGHAPHWYPRDHLFPVASIEDLRATLRRAYADQEGAVHKGNSARQMMLDRFSPEAIAPMLRQAVDEAIALHRESRMLSVAPPSPRWATVAGAWGDVFACVGKIKAVLAERGIEKIGVLYYGKDPRIADWLHAQSWCREVIPIVAADKKELDRGFARLCQCRPKHGREEWDRLLGMRGIRVTGEVAFTHLNLKEPQEPVYWSGAVLPEDAIRWARDNAPAGDFILLNPLSVASNAMKDHWPYWSEALTWLPEECTVPILLTGENEIPWPHVDRLINLTGQSRTMMDVLALAELSSGVISTSNNLGIYAPIADIPSVIVCARTCDEETFYHKWMEREPISLVEFGASFRMFQAAVRDRFGKFMGSKQVRVEAGDAEALAVAVG